ncbi:MAG: TetR/AcrR family transcriptional regulator [Clostridia bacterium]
MTQERIKAVALPLFSRHGYEGASLSEIAQGVGIKKPSIYAHFKGKDELFLAVFQDVLHDQIRYVEHRVKEWRATNTEDTLYAILRANCFFFKQHEDKAAFLKRAMLFPPEALKEELSGLFMQQEEILVKMLRDIFATGLADGQLRPNALEDLQAAYLAMLDGLFVQIYYYSPENHEEKIEAAWKIFWSGVRQ